MVRMKWPVLHTKPTVSSVQRSVHVPPLHRPRDSLDLHLASCYQHNRELFPDTSDTMRHPSRLPQHPSVGYKPAAEETKSTPRGIAHGGIKARLSIHSVKLGIGANHIAQTNTGFSRKIDGTFYSL